MWYVCVLWLYKRGDIGMTNAIIVNYDPFAMESAVYVVDDGLQNKWKYALILMD